MLAFHLQVIQLPKFGIASEALKFSFKKYSMLAFHLQVIKLPKFGIASEALKFSFKKYWDIAKVKIWHAFPAKYWDIAKVKIWHGIVKKDLFTLDLHISSFTGEHSSSGLHENSVDVVIEVSRLIYSWTSTNSYLSTSDTLLVPSDSP